MTPIDAAVLAVSPATPGDPGRWPLAVCEVTATGTVGVPASLGDTAPAESSTASGITPTAPDPAVAVPAYTTPGETTPVPESEQAQPAGLPWDPDYGVA